MIEECVLQLTNAKVIFRFLGVDPKLRWGYAKTQVEIRLETQDEQKNISYSSNAMFVEIYELSQLAEYFEDYLNEMKLPGPAHDAKYPFIPFGSMFKVFLSHGDKETSTFSALFLVNPTNPDDNRMMVGLETIGTSEDFELFLKGFRETLRQLDKLAERQ